MTQTITDNRSTSSSGDFRSDKDQKSPSFPDTWSDRDGTAA